MDETDQVVSARLRLWCERLAESKEPVPPAEKAEGDPVFEIAPQFEMALPFRERLAAVQVDGRFGFIDPSGSFVIGPVFDEVDEGFSDGLAAVMLEEKWGYIDRNGRLAIAPSFDAVHAFSEGLAGIGFIDAGRWGFINTHGKLAIPPKFDGVGPFSEAIAKVRMPHERRWGYVDTAGATVIPARFEDSGTGRFSRGFAAAANEKGAGLIDKRGEFVHERLFDRIGDFSEGRAAVSIDQNLAYVDRTGTPTIVTSFHSGDPFSEGLAAVAVFDHDAEARWKAFADEAYRTKGVLYQGPNPLDWMLWGYIDRSGAIAIEPQFERAGPFVQGLAPVRLDGEWGFIRTPG